MVPNQDQNQQTPNTREKKNSPTREFPELDPTEPQQPEVNPQPMMNQEGSQRGSSSDTNVNSQPDRENTSRQKNPKDNTTTQKH